MNDRVPLGSRADDTRSSDFCDCWTWVPVRPAHPTSPIKDAQQATPETGAVARRHEVRHLFVASVHKARPGVFVILPAASNHCV